MTYKEAAQAALDCQNAVNLSGVLFKFAEAMQAICDEGHKRSLTEPGQVGTHWKNTHPIVTVFLSKLNDLNDFNPSDMSAFKQVEIIAGYEQ